MSGSGLGALVAAQDWISELNIALLAKLVLVGKTCAARLTEREAE